MEHQEKIIKAVNAELNILTFATILNLALTAVEKLLQLPPYRRFLERSNSD